MLNYNEASININTPTHTLATIPLWPLTCSQQERICRTQHPFTDTSNHFPVQHSRNARLTHSHRRQVYILNLLQQLCTISRRWIKHNTSSVVLHLHDAFSTMIFQGLCQVSFAPLLGIVKGGGRLVQRLRCQANLALPSNYHGQFISCCTVSGVNELIFSSILNIYSQAKQGRPPS